MIIAHDQKIPSRNCPMSRQPQNKWTAPLIGFLILFLTAAGIADGAEISEVSISRENKSVSVNAELILDEGQIADLNSGIQKELIFYVDLFKHWNFWPDEFITGIIFTRVIKSDPIKKEFSLISVERRSKTETRYNSLETLLSHALKIDSERVFSTDGLQSGNYFVKVTVVSRIRKLAPIVGYLLFFVPEKEFSIERNSERFRVSR